MNVCDNGWGGTSMQCNNISCVRCTQCDTVQLPEFESCSYSDRSRSMDYCPHSHLSMSIRLLLAAATSSSTPSATGKPGTSYRYFSDSLFCWMSLVTECTVLFSKVTSVVLFSLMFLVKRWYFKHLNCRYTALKKAAGTV